MKRIITHPEETIYELVANSDCLEFWKSMGFEYNRAGDRDDEYYLRKTCSYGLKQEIGGLATFRAKGKKESPTDGDAFYCPVSLRGLRY